MTGRIWDRMKKVLEALKAAWITVWLIVVALLLAVTTTYAAYTGVTTSKRVISLSDRDDMLFSSRYMFVGGSEVQRVGFAEDTSDPKITIDVCNYDKNGLGKYGSDIYFTLTAKLIHYDGTEITTQEGSEPATSNKYRINYLDGENESITYRLTSISNEDTTLPGPETLYSGTENAVTNLFKIPGGTKNKLKFVLHCDPGTLSNPQYAVEVTATPVGEYDGDIKPISGKLRAISRSSQNLEWNGEFTDRLVDNDPNNFDAYNYVISGIGTGTITLTYNNTVLELDKNDLAIFTALQQVDTTKYKTVTGDKETVITFPVDTTAKNAVSRYAIHFYQKNGTAIKDFTESYVKTEFTK